MPHYPLDLKKNSVVGSQPTGSVRDRMAKAAINAGERLVILMDNSGSMAEHLGTTERKPKIEAAKEAIQAFLEQCDKRTSAVGLITFESTAYIKIEPVQYYQSVLFAAQNMQPGGGTCMNQAMDLALGVDRVTRMIIVSDGVSSSPDRCIEIAHTCKTRNIPCDCVFIGNASQMANDLDPQANDPFAYQYGDASGARLLKQIADITGGFYFTVNDFASLRKVLVSLEAKNRLLLEHRG